MMGRIATKWTHCLLAAVLLFCAAIVPFAPEADDFDENLGLASVQTLVSSHSASQTSVSQHDTQITFGTVAAATTAPAAVTNSAKTARQGSVTSALSQSTPPLRT